MSVQTSRSESLAESEVFHILGNDRRRAIVQLLARESGHVDVSDVATEIAETESDSGSVPNNLYKSVYVSLQQTHLPQLEEDGVIEYDSDAKTIQAGSHFDDVLVYIDGHTDNPSTFLQLHFARVSLDSQSSHLSASRFRSSRVLIPCCGVCSCCSPSLPVASIGCWPETGRSHTPAHCTTPSNWARIRP